MSVQTMRRDDRGLTNHQRIIDREMQRAHDSSLDLMRLPTRSRMRRAGITLKQLIKQNEDTTNGALDSLPMPATPIGSSNTN